MVDDGTNGEVVKNSYVNEDVVKIDSQVAKDSKNVRRTVTNPVDGG